MFVSVESHVVSYHVTGSEVRYRRQVGERMGDARGNMALWLALVWRNFS